MIKVKPYIYYDEKYPTHWISRNVTKQIKEFLEKEGFQVINANELKKLITETIRKTSDTEIVIVFSHDVVPSIILDNENNPTINSPLRQFLNKGHSVVWLGDIPLFYIGFEDGRKQSLSASICQKVLGLNPNPPNVKNKVSITLYGMIYNLPEWIGTRPHTGVSSGIRLISLAQSEHGNHAFIASYTNKRLSGFIRLYDFPLKEPLNKEFLKAIYNFAIFRNPLQPIYQHLQALENKVEQLNNRIETKFNTLKNELDNIKELINKILEPKKVKKEANSIEK
ncbi:MAG: hypothetical protein ACTSVW_02170 [Candidatus Njordarchaeales archaeon]